MRVALDFIILWILVFLKWFLRDIIINIFSFFVIVVSYFETLRSKIRSFICWINSRSFLISWGLFKLLFCDRDHFKIIFTIKYQRLFIEFILLFLMICWEIVVGSWRLFEMIRILILKYFFRSNFIEFLVFLEIIFLSIFIWLELFPASLIWFSQRFFFSSLQSIWEIISWFVLPSIIRTWFIIFRLRI